MDSCKLKIIHDEFLNHLAYNLNDNSVCAAGGNIYAYLGEFHNNAQRGRAIMGKQKKLLFFKCQI